MIFIQLCCLQMIRSDISVDASSQIPMFQTTFASVSASLNSVIMFKLIKSCATPVVDSALNFKKGTGENRKLYFETLLF